MTPAEKALIFVTLLSGVITIVSIAFRLAKTWFKFINDWNGGELKPGVMERLEIGAGRFEYIEDKLSHLDQDITLIKQELFTNGGSSLRDSINRIEANTKKRPRSTTKKK